MKITLSGYESINSYNSNIYYLGRLLQEKGYLKKIICPTSKGKLNIDKDLIAKEPFALNGIHLLLSQSWKYISKKIPERYYNETLFDIYSEKMIPSDSDVLVCTDSGLLRSIRRAKDNNIFTVVVHRTMYPEILYNVVMEEQKRFHIAEESAFTNKNWVRNHIKALQDCDAIFVLSHLAEESCVKYGIPQEKIRVISAGKAVDINYFKPRSDRNFDKFNCLFIGHKSLIKGTPYLIEAWKTLNLKKATLTICGTQEKNLMENYKKCVDFNFKGPVTNTLAYYHNASIFILPSLAEAFGRVVLEAMACGLPVIITECVGAKDIVEDGKEGFIVPIRNPQSIADKIQYFYDNPDEVTRMGKNARKKAENHGPDMMGSELIKLLNELKGN